MRFPDELDQSQRIESMIQHIRNMAAMTINAELKLETGERPAMAADPRTFEPPKPSKEEQEAEILRILSIEK